MITAVDLYCGLGGLTYGLTRGGVRVVAGIDVDPECKFPYEENNKAIFIEEDVRTLSGNKIRSLWGDTTYRLLAGCAPCQSFSNYSRKGRDARKDTRWELVADFGRLVLESRPDLVTMENVPQLLDHAIFNDFMGSLEGYYVWHRVVQCAEYGVPQTRKRLVLLASRLGPIALSPPSLIDEQATVRGAISDLTPLEAGEADPGDALHSACKLSKLNRQRIRASKPGGTWRDWKPNLVADCHREKSGETYPSVYGRMEWDAPAPTITTQSFGYGNGRFGHPEQHRAITLREAALLQTFPASYQFLPPGEQVRYSVLGRLIGNAVPVRIGEVIAESLLRHVTEYSKGGTQMKPLPAPNVPGNTDAQRMSNALRTVLTVSKSELLKKEARVKRASEKKRAKKPS